MINDRIESFVRRFRKGDAETMSLTETSALRSHLDGFIDESDLSELATLLSCYPTRDNIRDAIESMTREADRAIRSLYASGRCREIGDDELIM